MSTRLIRTVVLATAATWALAACETLRVTSDVNAALIHTAQCRTVAWAGSFRADNPMSNTIANPVNENRLRTAIAAQFTARGAQWVSSDPDCLVGYGIGVRNTVEGVYPGWGWGWGPRWGGPWGWYGPGPYVYREGLIAVDLYDARNRQPLWHAYVNQNLFGLTGASAEQRIDAAVAAIFMKYPR